VQLSNVTQDGDENDGIAWDAVAIQPLPAKPRNFVVALGDSFSSGEGAVADTSTGSQYDKETDVDGDVPSRRNNCHRSTRGWPLAATLVDQPERSIGTRIDDLDPALDFHELACSGAQTEHLLPEGVSNAFGELSRGSDGEVSQLAAGFLDENTSLVTLSIGGNDAGWSRVMEHCLLVTALDCQLSPMPGEIEPALEWLVNRINGPVYESIQKVLVEIHRLAPNAKIVLMGYPQLLSDEGSCLRGVTWVTSLGTRNAGVSQGEANWLNLMADELAERMQQAADTLRGRDQDPVPAFFADPRPDFAGHGVCNVAPFAPFFNGAVLTLTPGEKAGPLDAFPRFGLSAQSFHPNLAGAEAYARTLVRRIRQPDIGN
jgi:hypothetical protein